MKIVVTRELPPDAQKKLQQLDKNDFEIFQWLEDRAIPRNVLLEKVKGVHGIVCMITDKIDHELLKAAGPQLKVISTVSVGFDHIDVNACREHEVKVGNTPGVLTDACADLTVGLLLALTRRFQEGIACVVDGRWGDWSPNFGIGSQLTGKTVGVLGLGRIGEASLMRLIPFGISNALYFTPSGPKHGSETRLMTVGRMFQLKSVKHVSFEELLAGSDIVLVTCALNDRTKGILNAEAFRMMKQSAILVNTARGSNVNMSDLEVALRTHQIHGAALDVTDPEPLPHTSTLLQLPNVLVLPHLGSATIETREKMGAMAIDNLLQGLNGSEMTARVVLS